MEPRAKFFGKLRQLVGHLEKETAHLQELAENKNDDAITENACSTLHELQSKVRDFKTQIQEEIGKSREENLQVANFTRTCTEKRQQVNEALGTLSTYLQQYGYKPREPDPKSSAPESKDPESCPKGVTNEGDREDDVKEEIGEDDVEEKEDEEPVQHQEHPKEATPERPFPSHSPPLCTPKLTDFGLSELHLQNMLRNYGANQDCTPVVPKVMASAPIELPVPKTPKCFLQLDDDAPTPRLEDFGISEYTMRLNNDFTMDLLRKNTDKAPSKPAASTGPEEKLPQLKFPSSPAQPYFSSVFNEPMDTPETPEMQTPGLRMKKKAVSPPPPRTPAQRDLPKPESPPRSPNELTSPELPTFETPYVRKLLSVHKDPKPVEDSVQKPSLFPTIRVSCASTDEPGTPAKLDGECEDLWRTPEMPCLQSDQGVILQSTTVEARTLSLVSHPEPAAISKEPPCPGPEPQTEEWHLKSPQVRREFDFDPQTPEMPHMSSVTQDIFKLVAQSNSELKPTGGQSSHKAGHQASATGKENKLGPRLESLAPVTEREFQGLISYLKQIPLERLNSAIQQINGAFHLRQNGGHQDPGCFLMAELQKITGTGSKVTNLMLCLTQLKRMEHIHGMGNKAMYKLLPTKS